MKAAAAFLVKVALWLYPGLQTRVTLGHDTRVNVINLDELFEGDDARKREETKQQLKLPLENTLDH